MNRIVTLQRQRGITLVIGLILLVLITLVVTAAFMLSTTNLKAVGNMQFREEAIAAANVAVERVISEDFTDPLVASEHNVDIDGDGDNDYVVDVAVPVCIKSDGIRGLPENHPNLDPGKADPCGTGTAPTDPIFCYETVWEIVATVRPASLFARLTGARATVTQGINRIVNVSTNDRVCG